MKYPIVQMLLPTPSKRRSGRPLDPVKFVVAHDTGNKASTARQNVRYYTNSANTESASAHIFVDDKEIIECIPALLSTPEKAWHVLYTVQTDNQLFGCNANDAAIGVEYCFGDNINADEAYSRYVWVIAYICNKFNVDPKTHITGHFFLDPKRKTDPVTGLAHSRRTYEQLLRDVVAECDELNGIAAPTPAETASQGTARVSHNLNLRTGSPSTKSPIARMVKSGNTLDYVASVVGESVNGNAKWYKTAAAEYFWSGGVA